MQSLYRFLRLARARVCLTRIWYDSPICAFQLLCPVFADDLFYIWRSDLFIATPIISMPLFTASFPFIVEGKFPNQDE